MRTKTCIACKETKPLEDFPPVANTPRHKNATGRVNTCNTCTTNRRMKRQSGSMEIFLRELFTKSKSARQKKFDWKIEPEDVIELWKEQEGRCALSGVYMTHHLDRGERKEFNASIDRIRSNEGYIPGNVQLVCQRVNTIKNDLDEASLYWWVKNIYDNMCD